MRHQRKVTIASAAALCALAASAAFAATDWGVQRDGQLAKHSQQLFGVTQPLASSASTDIDATGYPDGADQVLLAKGLRATEVADLGEKADMLAFWPSADRPDFAFVCIEAGLGEGSEGVEVVDLASGAHHYVVTGTDRCDGIRTTDWGTVLFTEETGDGHAYELLDPAAAIGSTDVIALDRTTDTLQDNGGDSTVIRRPDLGTFAWEGLAVYPDGRVVAGDELRPSAGAPGGAIFKFTPASPLADVADFDPTDPGSSPLAEGTLEAFRAGGSDYGQGNQLGVGRWVPIGDPFAARSLAADAEATGYYRPEDLHQDPLADPMAIDVFFAATGRDSARNYGEIIRIYEDPSVASAPVAERFFQGTSELNALDNLAFQPHTGILYVIEDTDFGDVWACLRDGDDLDTLTDGCIRVLSVRDADAEPTGFTFDGSGEVAYLNIQHNDEATDPLLRITGFTLPR